jgi:hypothetical protein
MTSDDLRAWQVFMNLGDRAAAKALGIKTAEYAALLSGSAPIDHRTALACAALAAGLSPWGSHDGLDGSLALKPRPKPRHLLPVHD